jgi:hypothetical protein
LRQNAAREQFSCAAPARFAGSLTLAAMSLGYGVVQLDITIVNTALNASLVIAAGVSLTAAAVAIL